MEQIADPGNIEQAWNPEERRDPFWIEQQRPVVYVEVYERSTRDAQHISCLGRTGEFVRNLEQACSQQSNRLMRTRMLGGVGGVRRNPAPIPITSFVWAPKSFFRIRIALFANAKPSLRAFRQIQPIVAPESHANHQELD